MPRSYSELARKVQDYVPPERIQDREDLERAIREEFGDDWRDPDDTAEKVADEVEGERHDWQMSLDEVREAETRGGGAGSAPDRTREGGGFPVVRDTQGRVVGRTENVTTWVDRWGNVMAQNTDTGFRSKITDSENVDDDNQI